jgi:heme-degrading monooxygenase HmoA
MAVLVRMTAAGMDAATYDQASAQLAGLVRKQPGFMMHVAYPSPGGFSVGEVWESRGQFETWFSGNVKPNVPGVQHEVIELHAVVRP